jgi:hypothetical protein
LRQAAFKVGFWPQSLPKSSGKPGEFTPWCFVQEKAALAPKTVSAQNAASPSPQAGLHLQFHRRDGVSHLTAGKLAKKAARKTTMPERWAPALLQCGT